MLLLKLFLYQEDRIGFNTGEVVVLLDGTILILRVGFNRKTAGDVEQ